MGIADLIALGLIALLAAKGFRRGFVVGVLSLGGLVVGAFVGAKLAPSLIGDNAGRYQPLVALGGAMVLAAVGQAAGVVGGRSLRRLLTVSPLRAVDNAGGLILGAITGLAVCWAVGAVLLYVPGQTELRRYAQESAILSAINQELPPERVMSALSRIDALAAIAGPAANVDPPDPALVRDPDVVLARESVVRLTGYACGLGIEGSGWVAAPELVVTNAHVVAGIRRLFVDDRRGKALVGKVVAFDATNDVAVVHVPGLEKLALEIGESVPGTAGAMLGFPENGPYHATPVRVGRNYTFVGRDAYGRFPTPRRTTALRGTIHPGSSGGPVVDAEGRVLTTVFGARTGAGTPGGYGVPNEVVQAAIASAAAGRPIKTACVER